MPSTLSGRYALGERIGTGGSATVYAAHDLLLDRRVAIKVLDDTSARTADPNARQRFLLEAQSSARFDHPHAVATLDAGVDEGSLYLVMELVDGRSLAEQLAADGPMTDAEATRLGIEVLGALDAAHRVGLVHRDVKPANVLIDDRGSAKLADFGIAKRFDDIEDSLTQTGMVVGTRHYLSPEQAAGKPVGPASDIFSLGVVLFECLTGARPTPGVERSADNRLDVRALRPRTPPVLARVIATATAVPIADRFADASAMTDALRDSAGNTTTVMPAAATVAMPSHLEPTSIVAAAAILPPPATPPVGDGQSNRSRSTRSRRGWIAALLVLALGGAAVGLAVTRSDDDAAGILTESLPTATATSSVPAVVETTIAPTVAPAAVDTTVASAPPPTAPAELIPGFPVPGSIEEFAATLGADPDLVGEQGEKLAEEFEKLLEEDSDKGPSPRLRRDIEEWQADGELDPTIAAVALGYLDQLDTSGSNDDGD